MRKILLLLSVGLLNLFSHSQTKIPQLVSFSALVRDANNQPLVNASISIRLTFKEGGKNGSKVYCALHQNTTNQNGFMSIQLNRDVLGTGCNGAPSVTFEKINWQNGGYWMEVEYQTLPGTPFISLGELELASSFYAFAAGTAERVEGFNLTGAKHGDVLSYNMTTAKWEPMSLSGGSSTTGGSTTIDHDQQKLSVSATGDTLYLQNGGFVIIPGISLANTPIQLPIITTTLSLITLNGAISGGNITNDGNAAITQRGVCWGTNPSPTIADSVTHDGSGKGSFTSKLSGLKDSTTYYVRAYATNSAGTAYGNEFNFVPLIPGSILNPNLTYGSVSDKEGNIYKTVEIGTQTWMVENLRSTKYSNGDLIDKAVDKIGIYDSIGVYGHYNNDSRYDNPYGKLYNWFTVVDQRNICPTGWHVPSDAEWSTLINHIDPNAYGGDSTNVVGAKMKSTGTEYWQFPNTKANNESGFSGLPGGAGNPGYTGFNQIGYIAVWWSSSTLFPENSSYCSTRALLSWGDSVIRNAHQKYWTLSVRCLKD